ncbi:MAG TPA: class II fructose-bisphosphate aldolase [Micromonosporaceae bacterium]
MPLVETREIIGATGAGIGVAAFNVITLEHVEAVVAGAEEARLPVILQVSENAVRFHGGRLAPISAAAAAVAATASIPVALHLDHVTSEELLRMAPGNGFSSVMFDAAARSYEENVAATAAAARFAHEHGLWIEAELGAIGGKDGAPPLGAHEPGARTDPAEAAGYTAATGVDALAVAVGSTHARVRRESRLDHDLIVRLAGAVPVPLVLHGSSGVPDEEIARAVRAGITKVNVGTALNIAYTDTIREFLLTAPAGSRAVDPRPYLTAARASVAATVASFLRVVAAADLPV